MNALRLQAIRSARFPLTETAGAEHYIEAGNIAEELQYSRQVMSEHGWVCLDISYMSVEEVAREVMHVLGR